MSFDISKLALPLSAFTGDGPVIATKIDAIHPFREGKSIAEEIIGRKVTVVFPGNGYEALEVKVSDPVDAISPLLKNATFMSPVYVDFDDFEARLYEMTDRETKSRRVVLSVKAKAVRVVSSPGEVVIE